MSDVPLSAQIISSTPILPVISYLLHQQEMEMLLEVQKNALNLLIAKQLGNLFLFDVEDETDALAKALDVALDACSYCFSRTKNKYYKKDGNTYFNPFHSGQYSIFLYYLSRSVFLLWGEERRTLADRIYYLNKCLNSLDLFYEVEMPSVFFLEHPVGSVIGRAVYGDGFSFSQNCSVGNNKGIYPIIGNNVRMMSGSKILGKCQIGDNVIISANSYVKDTDIPSYSLVFGISPNLTIKNKPPQYFD